MIMSTNQPAKRSCWSCQREGEAVEMSYIHINGTRRGERQGEGEEEQQKEKKRKINPSELHIFGLCDC